MNDIDRTVTVALLQAVLDGLTQAVAVLDEQGGLIYWNAAACARLRAGQWRQADGCLRPPGDAERERLAKALPKACGQGRMVLLTLNLGGREAHAALAPVAVPGRHWAMLLLDREAVCGAIEMQLFAANIGLTLAESRVLARLVHGQRPAQIAREHGVSSSTVLTQVAALRAKTRCSSVSRLLADLARLPALPAARLGQG